MQPSFFISSAVTVCVHENVVIYKIGLFWPTHLSITSENGERVFLCVMMLYISASLDSYFLGAIKMSAVNNGRDLFIYMSLFLSSSHVVWVQFSLYF